MVSTNYKKKLKIINNYKNKIRTKALFVCWYESSKCAKPLITIRLTRIPSMQNGQIYLDLKYILILCFDLTIINIKPNKSNIAEEILIKTQKVKGWIIEECWLRIDKFI